MNMCTDILTGQQRFKYAFGPYGLNDQIQKNTFDQIENIKIKESEVKI